MADFIWYYTGSMLALIGSGWPIIVYKLQSHPSLLVKITTCIAVGICIICAIIMFIRGSIRLYKDNKSERN